MVVTVHREGKMKKWAACEIEYAVTEWLLKRGYTSVITHFYPHWWHECDVYSITKAGYGIEIEAKISIADFKADFKKVRKHETLAAAAKADCPPGFAMGVPRRFYFAVPEGLIKADEVPTYAGLLYVRHSYRRGVRSWNGVWDVKPAPVLLAAKKATPAQVRKLSEAYKFHYYTLLRKLAETQREKKDAQ